MCTVVAAALLAALAGAWGDARWAQADGPHPDLGEMPATFAAAARMIRDELGAIDRSRAAGDFADLARRGTRLASLAGTVPLLAQAPPALPDSAWADVRLASDSLVAIGSRLAEAAVRGDPQAVAGAAASAAAFEAMLEARVPRQYVCPMHCEPGKVYDRPGTCPICGMDLNLITSDRYSVLVTCDPGTIRAGRPVTLAFRIRDPSGFDVRDLQVVHEKRLHLIIVSSDLSWFAHVHPVPGGDGGFSLRFTFPAGGTYTLFHDFTPARVGMQVVPVEVKVEGRRPAPVPLIRDERKPKRIEGYEIKLTHTALAPGLGCGLAFWISRNGEPVTDLEPYLGAMGHLVIVSEDRSVFLHSHPLDKLATTGPIVQFGMMFPRTGLYKAWGQFQRQGRVVTVPFVFRVTTSGEEDIDDPAEPDTAGSERPTSRRGAR